MIIPAYRKYSKLRGAQLPILLAVVAFASCLEGLGFISILPLLNSLSGDKVAIEFDVLGYGFQNSFQLVDFIFITLAIFSVKACLTFASLTMMIKQKTNVAKALREEFTSGFLEAKAEAHDNYHSADILSLIGEQINRTQINFENVVMFLTHFLNTVVLLICVFVLDWQTSLYLLLVGALLSSVFYVITHYTRKLSYKSVSAFNQMSRQTSELVSAWKYLKSVGKLKLIGKPVYDSFSNVALIQKKMGVLAAITTSIREPLAISVVLSLVTYSHYYQQGGVAKVAVTALVFYRLLNAMTGVQAYWQGVTETQGAVDHVLTKIGEVRGSRDIHDGHSQVGCVKEIKISNLEFRYGEESKIKYPNLTFHRNKIALIFGPSGCGKSTLLELVLGLRVPLTGSVLVNSRPLKSLSLDDYSRKIGVVPQTPIIFNETLRYNVALSDDLPDLADKKVMAAINSAGLGVFFGGLKNGLDAVIEERGGNLSGGQKQKLCLARELYKSPEILVMDEPTSALDKSSREEFLNLILKLKDNRLIILVSHDDAFASIADDLYKL